MAGLAEFTSDLRLSALSEIQENQDTVRHWPILLPMDCSRFKRESRLDRLEPAVPADWKQYRRDSDHFGVLES
ncbi:hypothetical protein [Nocardia aurea]|uniref:hypothetical protein n=1 Tax=Nocardia aurea TaxID=2144174 RepID=UPI000D68AE19|nr:hypothetical protein [Nocardia aurea]